MNRPKLVIPRSESKKLLALPTREAEQLFQSYEKEQQLEILRATRNPKDREQLYYLVPDCTELIQESPTEEVLQVLDTLLGTGLASGLLPCLSNEQFEELIDIAVWRDGKLDEESLSLWLFEFSECDRDDLGRFLGEIDMRLIASLLKERVHLKEDYGGLMIEEGYIEPNSPGIDYKDEQAKAILNAIWEADSELFTLLLFELFAIDKEGDVETELDTALNRAREARAERMKARDREAGIDITEADLVRQVDLDTFELDEAEEDEEDDADE